MARTRRTIRILMFIILASVCTVSGCNKLNLEGRSRITITGNTLQAIDLNKTWEVNECDYEGPHGTDCDELINETTILFTLEPGATLRISLMHSSYGVPVPEGTFSVVDTECEVGVIAYFTASSQKKALYNLEISSGKMKVKDDEGTYDINFDFTISPTSGGGKLEGNFTGTIVQADIR
jgi:hypothetical protein